MVELDQADVFKVAKNAWNSGLLDLLPSINGRIVPGERFFESVQEWILENADLCKLDTTLHKFAPVIRYMADEAHWTPADFTGDAMFKAVRNLWRFGFFEVLKTQIGLPGGGDRYFEHCQAILVEKIGVARLDEVLHTLGQCIAFLATEAAMVNMDTGTEGRTCA